MIPATIIGGAQLGAVKYGVTNSKGVLKENQVGQILESALQQGIRTIDLAESYDAVFSRIGDVLSPGHQFKVTTKINLDLEQFDVSSQMESVCDSLHKSRDRVFVEKFETVFLHDARWLDHPRFAIAEEFLEKIRDEGLTDNIGISVYDLEHALIASRIECISVIQAPANALDQKFVSPEFLMFVQQRGMVIHIRSVYLQGLLAIPINQWPAWCSEELRMQFSEFRRICRKFNLTTQQGALGYIRKKDVSAVLAGVTSKAEVEALREIDISPAFVIEVDDMKAGSCRNTDPRNWPSDL